MDTKVDVTKTIYFQKVSQFFIQKQASGDIGISIGNRNNRVKGHEEEEMIEIWRRIHTE